MPHQKHLTLKTLKKCVAQLKRQHKKIVFTNGCFDLLHVGHVRYLTKAKHLGDVLIVGLNSDQSVRSLKGPGRPVTPLAERAEILNSLSMVDYIVPFSENTPHRLLKLIAPHIHVKGGDYSQKTLPEADLVRSLGGRVRILPLVPGKSTTKLLRRIR